MTTDNWIALAALVLAAATAVGSFIGWRANRESAIQATATADDALAETRRQSHALEGQRSELQKIGASLAEPPIKFRIDWQSGHQFVLRNVGTETAFGVTINAEDVGGYSPRNLPRGNKLDAGQATPTFHVQGASGHPVNASVPVYSADQPQARWIDMPRPS